MLKILTVVGTRPELIKLSVIVSKLKKHFNHLLVHTGQNYDYELNQIFFKELKIPKPNFFLNSAGNSASETIGNIIKSFDSVCKKVKPDLLLVLGDTNSCLASIAAKKNKIPIFHLEAGNRCFDLRVPEEINRKIVDHISDINLPYSNIAKNYLISEGISPDQIIKIGSPMKEVLSVFKKNILKSKIKQKLKIKKDKYFLVSFHREENVDEIENMKRFFKLLEFLEKKYKQKIVLSTHYRTAKNIKKFNLQKSKNIIFHKPFGFFDYINLQINAKVVLSDSGTITEESSILNFPAINLRESHERPEGMEEGSVIMTGLKTSIVEQSITVLLNQNKSNKRLIKIVKDYDVDNVSEKLVRIILSYFDYSKKKIWT